MLPTDWQDPLTTGLSLCDSVQKEKNSQASPSTVKLGSLSLMRRTNSFFVSRLHIAYDWHDIQYSWSTNSDPWSCFNLFRLEQLDCSPHYSLQTFPGMTARNGGFRWHPSLALFSPFPSTANVLGAQAENSNHHPSVFESFESLGAFPNY